MRGRHGKCSAHVFLAVTLCTAIAIGCNAKPYGLAPVSGVVTLDGQPAAGVDVSFQPQGAGDANPGPGSAGTCDDAGRYELQTQTLKGEPGAVVGGHSVRIYSHRPETPSASDTDATPRKERIPARYNFETELTFTVPVDGTTSADFALMTKPK